MQTSQKHENLHEPQRFFHDPINDPEESYSLASPDNLDRYDGSQGTRFPIQVPDGYCNMQSLAAMGCNPVCSSPSTVSFSASGSPVSQPDSQWQLLDVRQSPDSIYHSAASRVNSTDDGTLTHKLRELESAMLGPDSDVSERYNMTILGKSNIIMSETYRWRQMMDTISKGNLKEVLVTCAKAVADDDLLTAEWLMSELRPMVSVCGDPMQRLGAYMLEGLVARLAASGSSIYKALRCKEPTSSDLLSYMHLLYEVCPYFKFGYMSANGAIAEAMKNEKRIHIIDFQIAQGSQWITLIHALAARPGGPPHLRITGIDDPTSSYARGGGLHIVGQRLSRLAESCRIPFEFHAVAVSGVDVVTEHFKIYPEEAVAVNFALMLHHMPDESVGTQNHRDRLLRLVKSLSPKVVTLVEQESNTNTAPFFPRFIETLDYYMAVFESVDVALPREHKERINVEQHCLARDIVNVIACEGAERVERHELLRKWKSRFAMAGFTPYPLSLFVNATIKNLLDNYCKNYRLEERDGALYLGWMNRDLVVSCAWR